MDEHIKAIEEYILYREQMEYKEMLGYNLSSDDMKILESLRSEAIRAKYCLEEETKRLKKIVKTIK